MRKGCGRPVVVLDKYTRKEIARYDTIQQAATDLGIPEQSVRVALSLKTATRECYFVYEEKLDSWEPAKRWWRRVRGIKESPRVMELKQKAMCI